MKVYARFCLCLLGMIALALYAVAPAHAAGDGLFNSKLGPVPHGLPGPEEIKFPTKFSPGTIVVVVKHRRLYYVTSRGKALRYVVGVGREGMSWKGTATVQRKVKWPSWTPPADMRARARKNGVTLPAQLDGGAGNPLGARALYLYKDGKDTLYRIHGTNQPYELGKANTAGCIRMLNHHVAELFEKVKMGANVIVM